MSLGRTSSVALNGLDGHVVAVEAHLAQGLPAFTVTGLPDAACAQSPARVKAAAASSDVPLANGRIVVNLAPSSIPKHGSGFDLAIAVAILSAMQVIPAGIARRLVHLGELGLDGAIRPVPGVLPALLAASRQGITRAVVPIANLREALLVDGITVHAFATLEQLVAGYLAVGTQGVLPPAPHPEVSRAAAAPGLDLADITGQAQARAALELAAAGGHHLLLTGPPGTGKTMLAERLVTILPPLSREQALEVMAIRSVAGEISATDALDQQPPFVAPHHCASSAALVGGGSGVIRPGAASRAHHGVLFLDEAPEFRSAVLQALRQPLESGRIVLSRMRTTVSYPARFQLVLAANPCPCGNAHGKGLACTCSVVQRRTYASRLSGPLLDRVDLRVFVPAITRLTPGEAPGENSQTVGQRVALARDIQTERWLATAWSRNADVPGHVLRSRPWRLPPAITADLDRALERGRLTLRGYDRVLRVAWSCADLSGKDRPGEDDLALALTMRQGAPA